MIMELQNKKNIAKNIFFDILCFTLGGILYGISVSVFSEPNQIAPGGVTGISIILNSLIHTPVGISCKPFDHSRMVKPGA